MRDVKLIVTETEDGRSLTIGIVDRIHEFWVYGKAQVKPCVKYRRLGKENHFVWLVGEQREQSTIFDLMICMMPSTELLSKLADAMERLQPPSNAKPTQSLD